MDPPEVIISKGNTHEQLDANIRGCRNAFLRTLRIPEATSNDVIAQTNCDNKREQSFMLEMIPSPSEWIFVGRMLDIVEKRKYTVHTNSSSKDINTPIPTTTCSTLEYIFVCQINTSLQDNQTQQLLSLNRSCIDTVIGRGSSSWVTRFGETENDFCLFAPLERKWISISDLKACLIEQQSNKLQLEKKFRATATKILDVYGESIVKQDFLSKARHLSDVVRHDKIFVVDDETDTPLATTTDLLLGDDRLVLVF